MDDKLIANKFSDVTLESNNQASTSFCARWAEVRIGLELMKELIRNPIAKASISTIIAAGDALTSQICG